MSRERDDFGCLTCAYFGTCPDGLTNSGVCEWFDPCDDEAAERQAIERDKEDRGEFFDAWVDYTAQYGDGNTEG